jgi:hypothetical protein
MGNGGFIVLLKPLADPRLAAGFVFEFFIGKAGTEVFELFSYSEA